VELPLLYFFSFSFVVFLLVPVLLVLPYYMVNIFDCFFAWSLVSKCKLASSNFVIHSHLLLCMSKSLFETLLWLTVDQALRAQVRYNCVYILAQRLVFSICFFTYFPTYCTELN